VQELVTFLGRINTMRPTRVIVVAALSVVTVACAEPPKRVNPVGLSFAMYEEPAMTKASLAGVKAPVHIIVGSKDDQALPDVNARPIASAIPNAELEILPHVTHYTFLARCNLLGKVVARSLCTDPDGIDREEVHRKVGADALQFFNRTLHSNASFQLTGFARG